MKNLSKEELSQAIRAEIAVVEAEKEKEAREEKISGKRFITEDWFYFYGELDRCKEDIFVSQEYKNNVVNKARKILKQKLIKYLILSILLSLLVGYTASFIIKAL